KPLWSLLNNKQSGIFQAQVKSEPRENAPSSAQTSSHIGELLQYFMSHFSRKLKFRRYTPRTAQLNRACHGLVGSLGTETITVFGDSGAVGGDMVKKSPAGQVKAFVCKLARYCEVVVVAEFRTSRALHDSPSTRAISNQYIKREC
ncbi:hypothetical protein BBJ28_00011235, partial [Nothophytophthora sp. Chile5]